MNIARDERGGATLLYVVMVAMLIMILAPLLLSVTANEADRDRRDSNALIANTLAVSSIEAFIEYLDGFAKEAAPSRKAYVEAYAGFTDNEQYDLPDGTAITYTFDHGNYRVVSETEKLLDIQAHVIAQAGHRLKQEKNIVYTINVAEPPVETEPPEDGRTPVPEHHQNVYVQDQVIENQEVANDPEFTKKTDIRQTVDKLLTDASTRIQAEIATYESTAVTCNHCNSIEDLDRAIANSTLNPLIIRVQNSITIDTEQTYTWGTENRPVVVLIGGINFNKQAQINVKGDIVFTNSIKVERGTTGITVESVGGEYGNLYAKGDFNTDNQVSVDVAGTLYAGSNMNIDNNTKVSAGNLYAMGELNPANNTEITVARDIVAYKYIGDNTPIIGTGGDFMTVSDFQSNGKTTLNAGGLIAVGGKFINNQPNTVTYSGGGTTQLPYIPYVPVMPTDPESFGWNPTRR